MALAQYQIKPSGYNSGHPRFSLFTMPPTGHSILLHPNVESLINVRVSDPNLDKPPGQPSIYSATESGVALCVADWMEYLGFVRGSGYYQNKNVAGNIFLHHFGLGANHISLLHNSADALSSSNYATDHCYAATGINLCKAWATGFAYYLNAQITGRNLCTPYSMDMDFENGVDIVYPIVTDGINASGNWSGQQNDYRYGTQPIFERYIPETNTYTGITLSGMYSQYIAEGNRPPNPTGLWFQSTNYDFSKWYYGIAYRVNSYALYKSLIEPMRVYWPSLEYGNYKNLLPLVTGYGNPDEQNTWLKINVTGRHDTKFTYQMPPFYAPNMATSRYVTGVVYGQTTSDVYRNYAASKLIALTTGNNPLPIRGHLPISGQYTFYSGTAGNNYVHTHEDLLFVLQSGYRVGIQDWQVFYDSNYVTDAYMNGLQTLITEYISWYRDQESLRPNHVGPITRGGSSSFYVP